MNKIRTFLEYKNDLNIAEWEIRRALTGGQDLQDLRDHQHLQHAVTLDKRRWKLSSFMIHVRKHLERVAEFQKANLERAMGKRAAVHRHQQKLF